MSVVRTHAIVLRRTNYGEADRILQLLTPLGRLSVMAKGVRRERSKLAGGIELFAISDVVINSGRGELGILTSARLVQFFERILEDYDAMQIAYDVMKHVTRASEMIEGSDWYDVLKEVLAALNVPSIPRRLVLTWFYMRYGLLTGDELNLRSDVNGQTLSADKSYTYDVSEKGLREAPGGEITSDHIKFLRIGAVKPLSIIVQIGGIEPILDECLNVARQHASI